MKIEKGIPVPKMKRGKWVSLLGQMEITDSILVPLKEKETSPIYTAAARIGIKVRQQKVDENNVRFWRIE